MRSDSPVVSSAAWAEPELQPASVSALMVPAAIKHVARIR
jgi:hypothetical protein